ncbi:MAG TPA: serine hydrolase domain-containing protein, partial [Puia sp.]|nr:serine hydrolase domain-containing protein [Puia sp.]
MKLNKIFFSLATLMLVHFLCAAQTSSTKDAIAKLQKDIPQLLEKSDVPGMSIALIRNGKLVWSGAFGIANANTKKPVTENTNFEAASLSKPVFAYAVLKLVDEGKLDLDTPLNKYLGNNY